MEVERETEEAAMQRTLRRSRRYRIFGGVCGGIAEWLGWSPTVVRVLYILLSILSAGFPGLLVYIVLWIVMPQQEEVVA